MKTNQEPFIFPPDEEVSFENMARVIPWKDMMSSRDDEVWRPIGMYKKQYEQYIDLLSKYQNSTFPISYRGFPVLMLSDAQDNGS